MTQKKSDLSDIQAGGTTMWKGPLTTVVTQRDAWGTYYYKKVKGSHLFMSYTGTEMVTISRFLVVLSVLNIITSEDF
jgi:hypothetical protein